MHVKFFQYLCIQYIYEQKKKTHKDTSIRNSNFTIMLYSLLWRVIDNHIAFTVNQIRRIATYTTFLDRDETKD